MYSEVIYGPPGTGKSTALVCKVRDLLDKGVNPCEIVLCSFTKTAAVELRNKIGDTRVRTSTIHSLAYSNVEASKDVIVNAEKLKEFSDHIGLRLSASIGESTSAPGIGDKYLSLIGLSASMSVPAEILYKSSTRPGNVRQFTFFNASYKKWKAHNFYMDYNDLLIAASKLEEVTPIPYFFIDEAQDLTPLQWLLVSKWMVNSKEVYLAGDDDQAIYAWSGSDPLGMRKFSAKYNSNVVILKQSNRVSRSIHMLAEKVISKVMSRVAKDYRPKDVDGAVRFLSSINKVDLTGKEDCLVLYRNHYLRNNIEKWCIAKAIPYTVLSGTPGIFCGSQGKFVRLWLSLQEEYRSEGTIEKISRYKKDLIKSHTRLDPVSTEVLYKHMPLNWSAISNFNSQTKNYFKRVEKTFGLTYTPTIRFNTMHGSKGMEADQVLLINGMTSTTYDNLLNDEDNEIRVFYVAMTRARNKLDIVIDKNPLEVLF